MATPTVILKPKHAQPFFGRHPWVFAGAVDKVEGKPKTYSIILAKAPTYESRNGFFVAIVGTYPIFVIDCGSNATFERVVLCVVKRSEEHTSELQSPC